jgi:HAD superfamily hydrolase (TIGR01509 family)
MNSSILALLFDFDGLILDTETPEVHVWKRIYAEYGFEYPMDLALRTIGILGDPGFDSAAYLHELTRDSLDVQATRARHRRESNVLIELEPVCAGLPDTLSEARRLGLRLAVASSSPRSWVEPHLRRLDLLQRFDRIITADYVAPGHVKPYPDIYLKALEELGVEARQAIAFEDSLPGLSAARKAGIFAVAVPNPITAMIDLREADLVVQSFTALSLEELLEQAKR